MGRQLGPGDAFPAYSVSIARDNRLNLPTDLKGQYAVVIFYRGVW